MSDFINSKNNVPGRIRAKGNVHVGDINNYHFKGAEYEAILKTIKRLERLLELETNDSERLKISQELNEEQQKLEVFKKEVIALAELFQKIALDTERLKLAKQHFDAGEFKEACAILDAEKMTRELDDLLNEKDHLQEKQQQNEVHLQDKANEFLILAKLTAMNYELDDWFEKAKEYFEKSLRAYKNKRGLLEYAYFLQKHNEYKIAIFYYKQAINLLESASDLDYHKLADALHNLATLYQEQHELEVALKIYKKIIKILRVQANSNPHIFPIDLVMTLNNLANLYTSKSLNLEAEKAYKEAILICRKMVESPANVLAQLFSNIATFCKDQKQYVKSEKFYLEALIIQEKFVQKKPEYFKPGLAQTYNGLAALHVELNKLDLAKRYFQKSYSLYRELAHNNPKAFLPDLAVASNNFASILREVNETTKSLQVYLEAKDILFKLVQRNPKVYSQYLAGTYINIAFFIKTLR
ncbi:hypothetical protein BKI52_36625 [marine bacterium AO1-C]|nr:hypothetical protein BKI52_36625 [marine bacterium AO1-C]